MRRITSLSLAATAALLCMAATSGKAATITFDGSDTDIGASWRTPSVPKTDPAGTNVIGQDGWTAVGNGGSTKSPSYIEAIGTGQVYPGNGGYAIIDDPLTTPGLHPSTIQNGTVSPGDSLDWQFRTSTTMPIPANFQVTILVDNLDNAQYNSAATSISEHAGPSSASAPTTASFYNNQHPDLLYFTISGAAPGETFDVGGTAGHNTDITASVMAFDTITPEPSSLALLGLAGMGLLSRRRRAC